MKCMTVRQPYASQIVHGAKTIENRNRPTYFRGDLLIHAGAEVHQHYAGQAASLGLPLAAIVGEVSVLGSHSAHGCDRDECRDGGGMWPGTVDEASGSVIPDGPLHHWVLGSPFWYEQPVAAVGALGFWVPQFVTREKVAKQRRVKRPGRTS